MQSVFLELLSDPAVVFLIIGIVLSVAGIILIPPYRGGPIDPPKN